MEAISHFVSKDKFASSLLKTVRQDPEIQDFIPGHDKAAFSKNIVIQATISLNSDDKERLARFFLEKYNLILDKIRLPNEFTVSQAHIFSESQYVSTENRWSLRFWLRKNRTKKFTLYEADKANEEAFKVWVSGILHVSEIIPKIVYFPTFLFDMPSKIFLTDVDDNISRYYCDIMQDILNNNDRKLNIDKHVVQRINRLKESNPDPNTFISYLFASSEKRQIDAVFQILSNEISKIVFNAWSQILGKDASGKRVQVDWLIDRTKENAPYIELSIFEGQTQYLMSERSLGFRWFFSFLLFTQFRRNRQTDSQTIFIFDEPAANLHSKAQMKLLETFAEIAKGDTFIIYSTHSHYMINPLWLERAYIIQNIASDYDSEVGSFDVIGTNIKAIPYKDFVGQNPNKVTYFQPALDSLDAAISPLFKSGNAVIIEGKFDYYAIRYFLDRMCRDTNVCFYPGSGAGNLISLVNLFEGWAVNYYIILDDDAAGRKEKIRYTDELMVPPRRVMTIADIIPDSTGKSFESLYQDDVKQAIKAHFSIEKILKKHFALFFQAEIAKGSTTDYPETSKKFLELSKWVNSTFEKAD